MVVEYEFVQDAAHCRRDDKTLAYHNCVILARTNRGRGKQFVYSIWIARIVPLTELYEDWCEQIPVKDSNGNSIVMMMASR